MEQRREGKQTRKEKRAVRRVSVRDERERERRERKKRKGKKRRKKQSCPIFFMVFQRPEFGSLRIKVGILD